MFCWKMAVQFQGFCCRIVCAGTTKKCFYSMYRDDISLHSQVWGFFPFLCAVSQVAFC